MAKIYSPGPKKEEPGKEEHHKTVGVYERPERTAPSTPLLIALAVILAILITFLFYRLARGEDPLPDLRRNVAAIGAVITPGLAAGGARVQAWALPSLR